MLEVAIGMKSVAHDACDNPIVAMMAMGLDQMRNEVDSDEFLSALAQFAMSISANAVSGTLMLTLDENEQSLLAETIEDLMTIGE